MNTRLPNFDDVRAMDTDDLAARLIAWRTDRILSDPKLVREYIKERVQREVTNVLTTRLALIEGLYDEGYWE